MRNKKGFTLIELLAVIVILSILFMVGVVSVNVYINNSRKSSYITTIKTVGNGVVNMVNDGQLKMKNTSVTYYVPTTCVATENGTPRSPYGDFDPAYVLVNYNGSGQGYDYYWFGKDTAGQGVKDPVNIGEITEEDILSDITDDDLRASKGVDGRKKVIVFNADCSSSKEDDITYGKRAVPVNKCTYGGALNQGAEYTNGQYTYRYKQEYNGTSWTNVSYDGWGVKLTNPNDTGAVNSKICTVINEKPIVSMSYMFSNSKASSIDVSSFDTRYVVNMADMFMNATNITELDLKIFDLSSAQNISCLVYGCSSLTKLIMDGWDVSNVSNNGGFFVNCSNLKEMSVKDWKIGETSMQLGWNMCGSNTLLEKIDVTGWDLSETISLYGLFAGLNKLKEIVGINTWNTSSVETLCCLFNGCSSLETIDLSKFKTGSVTDISVIFCNCGSLKTIILDNWDLSNVTNYGGALSSCSSIVTFSAKNWIIPTSFTHVFFRTMSYSSYIDVIDVTGWDLSNTLSIAGLFAGYSGASPKRIVGLKTWNTSHVQNFDQLFYNNDQIENFDDIANWNTSSALYLNNLFQNCYALKSINLSKWNTSKVTSFGTMFNNCTNLESVNLDNWDVRLGGNNGGGFFAGASKLKSVSAKNWKIGSLTNWIFRSWCAPTLDLLDLTGWDLSAATDINGLLGSSSGALNDGVVGLSTWTNTSNVTNMSYMFFGANNTTIDISSWDVSSSTNLNSMFYGCNSLSTVYVKNNDVATRLGNASGNPSGVTFRVK